MKTDLTVCCGQIGSLTSRILNFTFPLTIVWATFSLTWIGPHFLQITVVPTTVFVTVFPALARTAAHAFTLGKASTTIRPTIVRSLRDTGAKSTGTSGR